MNTNANNNTVANTVRATTFAALGCFVSLTTPPKSNDKPYWSIQVRNDKANYSPRYTVKTEERAKELAATIAAERGIEVKVKAAPERPVIHPPAAKA
jgi:hypothetical protein